jgi:hypothetical protein
MPEPAFRKMQRKSRNVLKQYRRAKPSAFCIEPPIKPAVISSLQSLKQFHTGFHNELLRFIRQFCWNGFNLKTGPLVKISDAIFN